MSEFGVLLQDQRSEPPRGRLTAPLGMSDPRTNDAGIAGDPSKRDASSVHWLSPTLNEIHTVTFPAGSGSDSVDPFPFVCEGSPDTPATFPGGVPAVTRASSNSTSIRSPRARQRSRQLRPSAARGSSRVFRARLSRTATHSTSRTPARSRTSAGSTTT